MVIYLTTNLLNGKIYVGKEGIYTTKYLGSGTVIQYAINKYGEENFSKIVLEVIEDYTIDGKIWQSREQYWIWLYNAMDRKIGYNLVKGGEGIHKGYKFSPEVCKRKSITMTGENNPMWKHIWTEKERLTMSLAQTGKIWTDERKEQQRISWKNSIKSQEHLKQLHLSQIGKVGPNKGKAPWNKNKKTGPESVETRKKKSDSHTGVKRKPFTVEHRENMRIAALERNRLKREAKALLTTAS
jgi:group I intron endonuclease